MTTTAALECAVPAGRPRVVVSVAHLGMRSLIVDLLSRDDGRWEVWAVDEVSEVGNANALQADLVIVDTSDFARCCRALPGGFALGRVVVIGPEPDPAYRQAALSGGAGSWLSRERVAEELSDALHSALVGLCSASPLEADNSPIPASTIRKQVSREVPGIAAKPR